MAKAKQTVELSPALLAIVATQAAEANMIAAAQSELKQGAEAPYRDLLAQLIATGARGAVLLACWTAFTAEHEQGTQKMHGSQISRFVTIIDFAAKSDANATKVAELAAAGSYSQTIISKAEIPARTNRGRKKGSKNGGKEETAKQPVLKPVDFVAAIRAQYGKDLPALRAIIGCLMHTAAALYATPEVRTAAADALKAYEALAPQTKQ